MQSRIDRPSLGEVQVSMGVLKQSHFFRYGHPGRLPGGGNVATGAYESSLVQGGEDIRSWRRTSPCKGGGGVKSALRGSN